AGATVAVSLVFWVLLGLLPQHRAERFAGRLKRIPRVGGTAAEFWQAVWLYRDRQASVYLGIFLSWVGQVCFIMSFYCAANVSWHVNSGGEAIPGLVQHFLLVPIGLVVRAAIPVPGGLGIGEASYGVLYQYFGGNGGNGVVASVVQRLVEIVLAC